MKGIPAMALIRKYVFGETDDDGSLLILAAIHGNETAGTAACLGLMEELSREHIKIKKGRLTIVPVCNPEAYRRDVRSVEENLNRVMTMHENPATYEQRLANEICPLIKDNRVILDLHSTHCEGDVPFAFCDYPDNYNKKLIDALEVGYVLEGWPDIYSRQAEIQDFSTEHCAHIYGNTGTTLECGYHKSPAAVELAYKAVIQTLAAFGMIDGVEAKSYPKQHIRMDSYVIKQRAGKLCRAYKHLDKVSAGEPLAVYDDGELLTAPKDGFMLLPNLNAEIGTEWYYLGSNAM